MEQDKLEALVGAADEFERLLAGEISARLADVYVRRDRYDYIDLAKQVIEDCRLAMGADLSGTQWSMATLDELVQKWLNAVDDAAPGSPRYHQF